MILFERFRKTMFKEACFTVNQVYAWHPGFEKNNLGRWVKNGLLIKLRNGYYTFPEYLSEPNFPLFIGNRIYRPSYITIHTALAFYGLIPESVIQITNVTTLKTANFTNPAGSFFYHHLQPELFFGFNSLPFLNGRSLLMATIEKALLDLLYLYPFYKTEKDLTDLRLDPDILQENLQQKLMSEYIVRFRNHALEKRAKLLLKLYSV
jgi:predicted transcriptional regulator of viral defense system